MIKQVMEERNMLVEEIDGMFFRLRDDFHSTDKTNSMQVKVIDSLEEALQIENAEKIKYKEESEDRL